MGVCAREEGRGGAGTLIARGFVWYNASVADLSGLHSLYFMRFHGLIVLAR